MKITIGRDPESTIVISEDYDIVSNEHADIEMQGSDIVFTDHSSNGTIINGQKIHGQSVKIFPHDNIMLAGVCQLDWSQINQYIPRSGRPTVVHNIRKNVTVPPEQDDFRPVNQQQPNWQPSVGPSDEFPHSRPTEFHNRQASGDNGFQPGGTQWDNQRSSRTTEMWKSEQDRPIADFNNHTKDDSVGNATISQRDQHELEQWNWGAFYFGWLWGVCHKVWPALLQLAVCFIPSLLNVMGMAHPLVAVVCLIINLGVAVWLGLKGTQMAWDNGAWSSMEEMRRCRSKWNVAALICFAVSIVFLLVMIVFFIDIILTLI